MASSLPPRGIEKLPAGIRTVSVPLLVQAALLMILLEMMSTRTASVVYLALNVRAAVSAVPLSHVEPLLLHFLTLSGSVFSAIRRTP